MAQRTQQLGSARRLTPEDLDGVTRFIRALPEGDLTFFKEDFDDATIQRWCSDERAPRWVICDDDGIQAMLSLEPGVLWSAHVGEVRMVVGTAFRGRGLGRQLARVGLAEGVRLGMRKIVVEVAADKESDIGMFTAIGFTAEALMKDHICDHDGRLHDLVLLSHDVADVAGSMSAIGLGGELDGHGPA